LSLGKQQKLICVPAHSLVCLFALIAIFGYHKSIMTILGIETSCDETSAAVVKDGKLISNATVVQLVHSEHGGVVPELASRAHMQLIVPIVEEAMRKASVKKEELDAIAAVYGPGLIGSILVGLNFGKATALGLGIPFIGINHMEAHILSNMIEEPIPSFPFINLTVSGGHTQLVLVKDDFDFKLLGETMDDAAGEAFDKVAKMLGIGYPGGPLVDRFAAKGNAKAVNFPRPYLEEGSFQFSFSGLKTSVLYYLRKTGFDRTKEANEQFIADICASFQSAVIDVLIDKLIKAALKYNVRDIAVSGGVSANSELRRRLDIEARINHLRMFVPGMEFCTDNGAMVALAGYKRLQNKNFSDLELTAEPNLQLI
jgi:N6-L-threonylcarbamoyladenine synthase